MPSRCAQRSAGPVPERVLSTFGDVRYSAGDGEISLKEFRHFVRRRVAKGEPSPYAAFLSFQKKLRHVGSLGDNFWDARSLDLVVPLEKKSLWSAWEYHRHAVLRKTLKRPPKKIGGEDDLPPPPKEKAKKKKTANIDKYQPPPRKPRKQALKGEDLIDQCNERDFATALAAAGPSADQLVAEQARRIIRDDQARTAKLTIVVKFAKGLQKLHGEDGPKPDPFVEIEADFERFAETHTKFETCDPKFDQTFEETRVGPGGRESLALLRPFKMTHAAKGASATDSAGTRASCLPRLRSHRRGRQADAGLRAYSKEAPLGRVFHEDEAGRPDDHWPVGERTRQHRPPRDGRDLGGAPVGAAAPRPRGRFGARGGEVAAAVARRGHRDRNGHARRGPRGRPAGPGVLRRRRRHRRLRLRRLAVTSRPRRISSCFRPPPRTHPRRRPRRRLRRDIRVAGRGAVSAEHPRRGRGTAATRLL